MKERFKSHKQIYGLIFQATCQTLCKQKYIVLELCIDLLAGGYVCDLLDMFSVPGGALSAM